jgi:hypothetical protein
VRLAHGANAISVLGDDDVSERVMTYLAERTAVKLILLRGAASDNIHLPSARARGIQVWAPLPTLDADNIHTPPCHPSSAERLPPLDTHTPKSLQVVSVS